MAFYRHQGWKIQTTRNSDWSAAISRPGSRFCEPQFAQATREEGEQVCLSRAKAMIDRWEKGSTQI